MCSELVSTFQWTPSCVSLSPAGVLMAVGTEQGSLHLYHTHTNQVTATFLNTCLSLMSSNAFGENSLRFCPPSITTGSEVTGQ